MKPLSGKTILVTRPKGQADSLVQSLERLGAQVWAVPAIAIRPPKDARPLRREIRHLDRYDWLVFTSANGVRFFSRYAQKRNTPRTGRSLTKAIPSLIRDLTHLKIATIGPATAREARRYGFKVHLVPKQFKAESLAAAFPKITGQKILLARAKKARDILPKTLRQRGARVTVVEAYRTTPARAGWRRLRSKLLKGQADCVTFTASSTVESFFTLFSRAEARKILSQAKPVSIGPITSRTLRKRGSRPACQARSYTAQGLVQAIRRCLS